MEIYEIWEIDGDISLENLKKLIKLMESFKK